MGSCQGLGHERRQNYCLHDYDDDDDDYDDDDDDRRAMYSRIKTACNLHSLWYGLESFKANPSSYRPTTEGSFERYSAGEIKMTTRLAFGKRNFFVEMSPVDVSFCLTILKYALAICLSNFNILPASLTLFLSLPLVVSLSPSVYT